MKQHFSKIAAFLLSIIMCMSVSAAGVDQEATNDITKAEAGFSVRTYNVETGEETYQEYSNLRSSTSDTAEPYSPDATKSALKATSDEKALSHLKRIGVMDETGTIDAEALANFPTVGDKEMSLRSIIGSDNRQRVSTTTSAPYKYIGYLLSTFPSGDTMRGTAYSMGPSIAATAAHCLYDDSLGGWATDVTFMPAYSNGSSPYGVFYHDQLHIGGNYTSDSSDDWGMIEFATAVGSRVGYMGMRKMASTLIDSSVTVTGYPKEVGSLTNSRDMYTASGPCTDVANYHIYYDIDTTGGNSGGPIHQGSYAVGIHSKGSTSGNHGKGYDDWLYSFFLGYR